MDCLEAIRGVAKPKVEAVPFAEGKVIYVRGLPPIQRASFDTLLAEAIAEGGKNARVPDHVIVAMGLCHEDGTPSTATPEERLSALQVLEGALLSELAWKILRLSGYVPKAIEAAAKN